MGVTAAGRLFNTTSNLSGRKATKEDLIDAISDPSTTYADIGLMNLDMVDPMTTTEEFKTVIEVLDYVRDEYQPSV